MDNKQKADKLRAVIGILEDIGLGRTAEADELRRVLDILDPPKPEWPDGTIAWVSGVEPIQSRCIAVRYHGAWRITNQGVGGVVVRRDENVTKVEPLRVLADDQIAVARLEADPVALRDLVEVHATYHDPFPHLSFDVRQILAHYADALDEAEARPTTPMTREQALEVFAFHAGIPAEHLNTDPRSLNHIFKVARRHTHPDREGGSREQWDLVEQAARVLGVQS